MWIGDKWYIKRTCYYDDTIYTIKLHVWIDVTKIWGSNYWEYIIIEGRDIINHWDLLRMQPVTAPSSFCLQVQQNFQCLVVPLLSLLQGTDGGSPKKKKLE